jgi:hypothetical protein
MSETNLVRPSRDGDQFHYVWAARRCLLLLSPNANLKALTIEGSSLSETADEGITEGEELIDVGEYYGSEDLVAATQVRYIQLKHSTLRADNPWAPSELEKTLAGFSARYKALQKRISAKDLDNKLEFWFVSNRPVNAQFLEAVRDAAQANPIRHNADLKKLEKFAGLNGAELSAFCKLLRLEGGQDGLWDQQNVLAQNVTYYLADADVDAPIQLKELVTKKALSASADNPSITRIDVLRALKTDENRLYPAPCLIKEIENMVPREQEPELLEAIVQARDIPVIVHADGGVGKSIFATRIIRGLPEGSFSVLYDCFGDGQYRSASGYRHRHRDALVQIANELASSGLCHPLIPTPHAESSAYVRAFLYRLRQSITSLKTNNENALLSIVIDAADNAQTAAEEIGEARSFVRDLIREQVPDGVRLVFLCRTHRQDHLAPPPETLRLKLNTFSRAETATYLRKFFPAASEQDIDEFHRLSSQNPRVQALALSRKAPLGDILRALGPNPTTVADTIGSLLDGAVAKLRDVAGTVEKTQIDSICAGLAALRPLIPLSVLASMAGVNEAAIKSFAYDLGRPLLISGDTIQFFDEPSETWFIERFKPTASNLATFIASLKPLAAKSAYVASALPQLMLEAGHIAELVELALSSEALPDASPIEKRDVELQRLQFALKASLRAKRYTDAVKLALKAGGESAGDERQRKLLQANTDLAAVFMESDRIQELVSRRTFGSGWVGSHHAYEAGLLSGRVELLGDARSRLRMTHEWLRNWSHLPEDERKEEEISDDDIVEITTAYFNIHGAARCADNLRGWQPREVSFRVGRIVASRFIDQGRYNDLNDLGVAAGNNIWLVLAIVRELREVHRTLPASVVKRTLRLVSSPRVNLKEDNRWDRAEETLQSITALVEVAHKLSIGTNEILAALLTRYLPPSPPRGLSSRYSGQRYPFLRAYALRETLSNRSLVLKDLADDELRKELEVPKAHSESREVREFKESIGALLPWHLAWAKAFTGLGPSANRAAVVEEARTASSAAESGNYYRDESNTVDEIARLWFDTLLTGESVDNSAVDAFNQWAFSLKRPLFTTTLTHLARVSGQLAGLEAHALEYAGKAFNIVREAREQAESKSESYVDLARAVLIASRSEATAYFNEAVEVASRIGDENLERWSALLDLADRAGSHDRPSPVMAYRLARCAELTYQYVVRDKHFDWTATVEAIAALCASSSIAILSRWRDRNFGWAQRILPIAIAFLCSHRNLNPKLALTLIGFRARWDEPLLLENALAASATIADKQVATEFAYRYMTLDQQTASTWRKLKNVLDEFGVSIAEVEERITLADREEQSKNTSESKRSIDLAPASEIKDERNWNAVFEGIDLGAANDISVAHKRFKDLGSPYFHEDFFEEAFRRVSVGREAEFVTAFANVTDLNLYHFRNFLEQMPESWKGRLAVKSALAQSVRAYCQRFCMEITKSRYYQMFPLKAACELSGVTEHEITDVVLTAIGEVPDIAGASRLFTLVGLLIPKLTSNEALEALSFGLDLLDNVLEDTDGDGPWVPKLEPSPDIEGSLAGYIWGCLAAPKASLRWEATHVVRAICSLGHSKVLAYLIGFAKGTPADAYHDAYLHFYKLHARQWLLIGLSRAAKIRPDILVPHADLLMDIVFSGEPHVYIREIAKRTLLDLLDAGLLATEVDLRSRLLVANISTFPAVQSKSYRHIESDDSANDGKDDVEDEEDRFYFGIDLGPYWFAPLGRCFAKSQVFIEREALRVIRADWGFSGRAGWATDERHRRNIFKDGDTRHSHGSHPPTDELSFYLSYHAMMVVAGKLLLTTPVHHDPDELEDEFRSWLKDHDLSRQDGGWLADRRDPDPLERPNWKDEKETDDWRWQISKTDFDGILVTPDDRMNLWGSWTRISGHREESIGVASALVSSDRSVALLSALQSTSNAHDYRIPDADDDLQIDSGGFQLKGWLTEVSGYTRLDEYDPWAGAIRYPPPAPAAYVIERFDLNSDVERRRWFVDGVDVAWAQTWGHFHDKDEDESSHESGARFQASLAFMKSLLQEVKMDLIVAVEINRRRRRARWEKDNDEHTGYVLPSARLFLLKCDGSICAL